MGSDSGRRGHRGPDLPLAYTTGQAARFCYVTSDTILNWIHAGSLMAQRTAGGQYRIRREDLIAFMREHGMRTDVLEADRPVRTTTPHTSPNTNPEDPR